MNMKQIGFAALMLLLLLFTHLFGGCDDASARSVPYGQDEIVTDWIWEGGSE